MIRRSSPPRRPGPRRGLTLVDVLIASLLFCLLVGALARSLAALTAERTAVETTATLQDMGTRAMEEIYGALRVSGFAAANGVDYPYLFEDGDAQGAFAAHAHPPADKAAQPGDPDFGPNREIVFCFPADADGNDVPDIDAGGALVWDADESSFVVVTEHGINFLERRVNGGDARPVASHVERVAFDDATTSGFAVPLDAIRVRIWFRRDDGTGLLHTYFVESTIKLRNG
ncbi:MAG: hypothetical protein AB1726_11385 [Planctomycetota bacterium]